MFLPFRLPLGNAEREPICPTIRAIPPSAENRAVAADSEQIDVLGGPRDSRHLTAWLAETSGHVEPGGPVLSFMPPGTVDPIVRTDHEQVEVIRVSSDRGYR